MKVPVPMERALPFLLDVLLDRGPVAKAVDQRRILASRCWTFVPADGADVIQASDPGRAGITRPVEVRTSSGMRAQRVVRAGEAELVALVSDHLATCSDAGIAVHDPDGLVRASAAARELVTVEPLGSWVLRSADWVDRELISRLLTVAYTWAFCAVLFRGQASSPEEVAARAMQIVVDAYDGEGYLVVDLPINRDSRS
jgi:hypothetical protein